jgi:RimJ/RimL family protein N-acetyltransferase
MENIIIRQATKQDIASLQEIFAHARLFMKQTGNPHQWAEDYPSVALLEKDIESGDCYVCMLDKEVVACFVLRPGNDPTYTDIYEGAWLNDAPYATIHRIASLGKVSGIMHKAMCFAKERYHSIRIDTHRDNMVMRNAIQREGFKYCGIIHCWNGDERLAYQYNKE